MYIDTHSKDSMQTSICAYLNTSLEELQKLFDYVCLLYTSDAADEL